jgi:outer membrane protein TolC
MIVGRRRLMLRASVVVLAGSFATGCAIQPQELTPLESSNLADNTIAGVNADQQPITGSIDIHEAVARALMFNLDHQVELADMAVRESELELAHYSLLPNLVANSGYIGRDNVNASSSQNALTGIESLATSTSQDRRQKVADATFSWNILDFGLSYVRARQSADKVLVQNELRRKVALRIVEDTRTAFWRALSAQRLLKRLQGVEQQARSVEREARQLTADKVSSPITSLTYEREIVDVQRTIGELQRELIAAKTQLGTLMNIIPGTPFTLAGGRAGPSSIPNQEMATLIHTAVMNRPELREVAYRQRINEQEAHAALLEMLPGLNIYSGSNFDSNTFLLNNSWQGWGVKATWSLLKVFSYPARSAVIEQQDELLNKRALAITMSIMTQVYVSRIRYAHSAKEHGVAQRYHDVQQRLVAQIRAESAAGRVTRQTLVREELNTLVAEAKLDIAHADLRSAHTFVLTSMGLTPDYSEAVQGSLQDAAALLRKGVPMQVASAEQDK